MLKAYVDGAHVSGMCAWAFVVIDDGKVVARHAGWMDNMPEDLASQRNVAAEMKAAMMAAAWGRTHSRELVIYYDYTGIENWITGEWGTGNPYTKAYRDYMTGHESVEGFVNVEAHSGNKWNEMADRMAHSAARSAAKTETP